MATNLDNTCPLTQETNCGWYTPPSLRGTSDIIWSCLLTIALCLSASLHLNVPSHVDNQFVIAWRKAKWMLISLLAPELVTLTAIAQWTKAWWSVAEMKRLGHNWTMSHGFFTVMGGFVVSTSTQHTRSGFGRDLYTARDAIHCVHVYELCDWVKTGRIRLPQITEQEINDKSRMRTLVLCIAFLQTSWFILQCAARATHGLSISKLEIVTLAYVLCAITSYCFWWNKPYEVTVSVNIGNINEQPFLSNSRAPNVVNQSTHEALTTGVVVGTLVGGIYCLAWNSAFPTLLGQLLWRISTAVFTIMIPLSTPCIFFMLCRSPRGDLFLAIWFLPYVLCNVYLLFEGYSSFRSAPGDIYQAVEWMQFLPHVI